MKMKIVNPFNCPLYKYIVFVFYVKMRRVMCEDEEGYVDKG